MDALAAALDVLFSSSGISTSRAELYDCSVVLPIDSIGSDDDQDDDDRPCTQHRRRQQQHSRKLSDDFLSSVDEEYFQ